MQRYCRGFVCAMKSARKYSTVMNQETEQVTSNRQTHGSTMTQLSPDTHQSKHSTSCSQTAICDPSRLAQDSKRDKPDSWTAAPASAFHIRKPIRRKPIVIAAKFGNHPASAIKVSLPPRRHFAGESSSRDSVGMRNATICSDNIQQVESAQDKGFGGQGAPEASAVDERLSTDSPLSVASQLLDKGNSGPEQSTTKDGVVFAMDIERVLLGKEEQSSKSASPANVQQKVLESDENDFLFAMDVESLLLEEDQGRHKSRKRKNPQGVCSTIASDQLTDASSHIPGGDEESQERVRKQRRNWKKRKPINKKARVRYEDEEDPSKSKPKKAKKPLPNAFVSVRIPSAEIRGKMKEIQDAMLEKEKKVKSTLVSLDKLHITLMVLRIDGEEPLERAKLTLQRAAERVAEELAEPLLLEFSGVGSFGRRVVFALLKEGTAKEKLTRVADVVRSTFESHDLPSTDSRAFNPHLTIAKVSRAPRFRGIEPELYSELVDTEFGREAVAGLELLSMTEPPTDDGYYHCLERCSFIDVGSTKST